MLLPLLVVVTVVTVLVELEPSVEPPVEVDEPPEPKLELEAPPAPVAPVPQLIPDWSPWKFHPVKPPSPVNPDMLPVDELPVDEALDELPPVEPLVTTFDTWLVEPV